MEEEKVILVTPKDEPIGMMPKMEAHEKAVLHRAFSVFVINSKNELMLQQRAFEKYHSPGLWTNTCCSHQRSQEGNIEAGTRRLKEEMGFETDLEYLFNFIYKAPFDNGLTEHELDHVMLGRYENKPKINPNEVASWKWMHIDKIHVDLINNTENYTTWFAIIFERFYNHLKEQI